jgi:hypothetical protein
MTDLPDFCRLHIGLYLLADQRLQLPYNIEELANSIFGGEDPGIYEMLGYLAQWNFLEIGEDTIFLPDWPRGKKTAAVSKTENISLVRKNELYHPELKPGKTVKDDVKRNHGLYGISSEWKIFRDRWPHKVNNDRWKEAKSKWDHLLLARKFPPITVLLTALDKFGPQLATNTPAAWLKSRPWESFWTPPERPDRTRCPYCLDQGHRIITDEETGQKKHIVCSCKSTTTPRSGD